MRKRQWRQVMGIDSKTDKMDATSIINLVNKFNGHVPDNNKIVKGNNNWDIDQKMVSVYIHKLVLIIPCRLSFSSNSRLLCPFICIVAIALSRPKRPVSPSCLSMAI